MMKMQILGSGCPKCEQLAANAAGAADSLGIDYEMEKITDVNRIAEYGMISTPALVVDGQVKLSGKVPSPEEIRQLLR